MSDAANLGSCCVCESTVDVYSIIMLGQKAPMTGRGWGCVVCDLAADGALAVICEACAAAYASVSDPPLRFACRGYPGVDGRVPIGELTGTHTHDPTRHPPDIDLPVDVTPTHRPSIEPRPGFDWSQIYWSSPDVPVDDTCSYCAAEIPDEAVPMRMWNDEGWAAVFCKACMATWWGMRAIPDDDE